MHFLSLLIASLTLLSVFLSDSLETLSRRHYEMDIEMMAQVIDVLDSRITPEDEEKTATMRMNAEIEAKLVRKFDDLKELSV